MGKNPVVSSEDGRDHRQTPRLRQAGIFSATESSPGERDPVRAKSRSLPAPATLSKYPNAGELAGIPPDEADGGTQQPTYRANHAQPFLQSGASRLENCNPPRASLHPETAAHSVQSQASIPLAPSPLLTILRLRVLCPSKHDQP